MTDELTHTDAAGKASMVDVGDKPITRREATAEAIITMAAETLALIESNDSKKGDVRQIARIAGIMGAKHTSTLIPLCHQLPLDKVSVDIATAQDPPRIIITTTARCTARTGVEMEALTAASVAALTIYDMAKAIDRGMTIGPIRLLEKSGGRSGDWSVD
jgi:cyclic pyranopterin phosphate synthase